MSLGEGVDVLNPGETVSPGLIGSAVDYLTRFMLGDSVKEAFAISMLGGATHRKEVHSVASYGWY